MGGTLGLFVVMVVLFGRFNNGSEFFPESVPPAMVMARIDAPSGTRTEFVNGVAERVEARLEELDGFQDVESVVTTVGGSGGGPMGGGGDANVSIHFMDYENRSTDVFGTIRTMQSPAGAFYYQRWPVWTTKVSYMRWNQAWMYNALAILITRIRQSTADVRDATSGAA